MCFGGGPSYSAPPIQVAPKLSDKEVEAAMARERELARRRKGRRSTILTSLIGDYEGGKRTLLGS
ncbi:MAG: hypothetical protein ABIJ57_12840 [Pseudomonadota bacterium]